MDVAMGGREARVNLPGVNTIYGNSETLNRRSPERISHAAPLGTMRPPIDSLACINREVR